MRWIVLIVSLVIVGSVFYELLSGVARLRGVGLYARSDSPAAYWLILVSKLVLALLIALLPSLIHP